MPISVDKLISICVQLAREGCHIVKEYYFSKDIKKYNKSPNDPVTEVSIFKYRPTSKSRPSSLRD